MIENEPIQGWQDETLAVQIDALFHKLKTLIAAGKMPHYFMRKSNMLAGVPQYKLQNVNERIYRVRENFVFFLGAQSFAFRPAGSALLATLLTPPVLVCLDVT